MAYTCASAFPATSLILNASIAATAADSSTYLLSIRNVGKVSISGIELRYDNFLGPGSFGLDDTHMPVDIWIRPDVCIGSLTPGEERTVSIEGYGIPAKFDRPRGRPISVGIGVSNDNTHSASEMLVPLAVCWAEAPHVAVLPNIPGRTRLHELKPVIGLFLLGLLFLAAMAARK